jgi:hypothetical protein
MGTVRFTATFSACLVYGTPFRPDYEFKVRMFSVYATLTLIPHMQQDANSQDSDYEYHDLLQWHYP